MFEFKIVRKDKNARTGIFTTPHGDLHTPELAFVATEGELKSIPKNILEKLPVNLIIVNTFHLWTKELINTNIHDYAQFPRPVESDSGGFQAFSLGFGKTHGVGKVANIFPGQKIVSSDEDNPLIIDEDGVTFTFNGQKIILTPEKSMELQQKIGADIMFAFDECTSPLNSKKYTKEAMERTHRWLKRCLLTKKSETQALFAIAQGGYFEDLRKTSAEFVAKQDVPGFGIGGSLGRTKEDVLKVLDWTIPLLPDEKPRHLLGIGQVRDIFESVERGVDLFDCVIPTREARHKVLYTRKGKINVRKMRTVNEVADKHCRCKMCTSNTTIQQLNNLFIVKDPQAFYYATVHNIQFFSDLMKNIREALENNQFQKLKEKYLKFYP